MIEYVCLLFFYYYLKKMFQLVCLFKDEKFGFNLQLELNLGNCSLDQLIYSYFKYV